MIADHRLAGATGAELSPCEKYRYTLWRVWDDKLPVLGYIMLNPSTADASVNDATITRCMERARQRGYGGIMVANLYAFRAKEPADLFKANDPIGDGNAEALLKIGSVCADIVCAWGAHPDGHTVRSAVNWLRTQTPARLLHLGLTKGGEPRHPLYIGYAVPFQEWT